MNKSKSGISKTISIVVAVVIVVAAIVGVLYALSGPLSVSFNVATSTSVGTAGSAVSFSVLPSVSGTTVSSVLWNFGDGTNQTTSGSTTSHTYANGGYYLIYATVTASYQNIFRSYTTTVSNSMALFPLQIQANLTTAQSVNASVPTINFPVSKNPTAPIFNTGDTVYPIGGYLQAPSNSAWSISSYSWDFANGNKPVVNANSTGNGLPLQNVTTSYSASGLYPMALTLKTNTTGASFSVITIHTVAIKSSSMPFALLTSTAGVVNPNVITAAEVVPGGPSSFDPQIDYETVGFEVVSNVFETLVLYNGSSTNTFIPVLAAALPAVGTGITSDYKNYTFTIRSNQQFSNGDKVTAYDVWFSFERAIAFVAGKPGTPDWIQSQFLVPGVLSGVSIYANNTWPYATNSITYSNASNTVTFHFNRPMSTTLAFQIVGDPLGGGVVDSKYACSAAVGACFQKSTSGFLSYQSQGFGSGYNTAMRWSPIGSGPYMVQSYTPGQSVELVPNPHYTSANAVPGIPAPTKTVVIDWVKTPDTALLMLQDGQADSAAELPPSDFPAIQQLQSKGLVHIYNFPTINVFFYTFNININKSMEATQFGIGSLPGTVTEPFNYFADISTRMAWINAYDYANYLNNILGNAKYGANFGYGYQGILPTGMNLYTPANQLGGLPSINLNNARGNFSNSAWKTMNITVPIIVPSGDPVELAAASQWAITLHSISGGMINGIPYKIPFSQQIGDSVPKQDPMGVYWLGWIADYPDPSDYVDAMYALGGTYPSANDWIAPSSGSAFSTFATTSLGGYVPTTGYQLVNVANTGSSGPVSQDLAYKWLNGNITAGDTSTDLTARQAYYKTSELLAIDLGLYAYVLNAAGFWYYRSWLSQVAGTPSFPANQENPMVGAGGDILYFWVNKG